MISPPSKFANFVFHQIIHRSLKLWESMEKGVHVGRSDTLAEIEKKIARDPDLFLVAELEEKSLALSLAAMMAAAE